jgi:succinate dehydrogenase / fumarate reductase cytochrome b subunit
MPDKRFRGNKLGILGWLSGGRYGVERYAYTLHRITGLGLLFYFILHILVTSSRAFGQDAWETWMGTFESPIFKLGEYMVFAAFAFHAFNGIRLFFLEIGIGLGKPIRPIYPYRVSIHRQRPFLIVMMLLAAIIIVAGGYDFFLAK